MIDDVEAVIGPFDDDRVPCFKVLALMFLRFPGQLSFSIFNLSQADGRLGRAQLTCVARYGRDWLREWRTGLGGN